MRGDGFKTALIYAACAAALGFAAAFILCALSKPFVAAQTAALQVSLALAVSKRQPSIFYTRSSAADDKKTGAFSPFGVPEENAAAEPEPPEEPGNIEELALAGTIPNIGAWLEAKDGVKFVRKGKSIKGYKLEHIERNRAVLSRDGKNFPLFLVFWMPPDERARASAFASNQPPSQRPPTPPRRAEESAAKSGVKQAVPNGADGTINREVLNELLSNPLEELKNMRLIPADNGMMIERMNSKSLFRQMGIEDNDVITNINGIDITDMGNAVNVMSSVLGGTRFDFQIERGGKPLKLHYAVE